MKTNHLIIGVIVLIVAGALGYYAWDSHQTGKLRAATLEKIAGATLALRTLLAPVADPVAQSQAVAAAAERVDRDLIALRAVNTSRILLLGAGADTYLHATRELLKRQAALLVLDSGLRHGISAFRDLLGGNRSAPGWASTAVQQKNRLEQDYREYRSTLEAHARIIDGLPDAIKALAPQIPDKDLVTTTEIAGLRAAVASSSAAISAEMEALRGIAAPR